MYVIYEINLQQLNLDSRFTLGISLFLAVKLTKDPYHDKYFCSGYGNGFEPRGFFLLSYSSAIGKNVIIFGVDNSSSVDEDNGENIS